jgi:DNA-binding protein YbaB
MSQPVDPAREFFTPDDFPPFDETEGQQMRERLAELKTATYPGRDAEHLVTVVIDGDAMVNRIRFASTASTRSIDVVERAIAAALASAQAQRDKAVRAVIGQSFPELAAPAAEPVTYGGIEMAYEEAGDA